MKTQFILVFRHIVFWFGFALLFAQCQPVDLDSDMAMDSPESIADRDKPVSDPSTTCNCLWDNYARQDMDEVEISMLLYMWEEKKLIRDLNEEMFRIYKMPEFRYAADMADGRMSKLYCLVYKHYLVDRIAHEPAGFYTHPVLQELFSLYLFKAKQDKNSAMCVTAMLEELSIYEFMRNAHTTQMSDVKILAKDLVRESRNDLKTYVAKVEELTKTAYKPRYLSQLVFEEIMNTPKDYHSMVCDYFYDFE